MNAGKHILQTDVITEGLTSASSIPIMLPLNPSPGLRHWVEKLFSFF
jgi:hypothetical protein